MDSAEMLHLDYEPSLLSGKVCRVRKKHRRKKKIAVSAPQGSLATKERMLVVSVSSKGDIFSRQELPIKVIVIEVLPEALPIK